MEITKHLFLNLSILIILLFFCFIFFEKYKSFTLSKSSIILFFFLMIWFCIQFSYNSVSHTRYDLRAIPLVIGGLYFGIGPMLAVTTVIIRLFYGVNIGFYQTLVLYGLYAIVVWRLYPWFWKQAPLRRVLVSISNGMALGIVTVVGMQMNKTDTLWLDAWFAYLVMPALGIGIISYSIEFFKKNIEMGQQLIKAEKLKAVEQMGAAISHEIRNPLTAASGFVQLLEDDYLPRQKRKEYLSIVKEELHSAEKVIQDYLTFAKPSIEMSGEINVKSELRQIITLLQPLANQNSVEFITDFSIIGFIKGDPQKFRQCFINVMKNAIEAMPHGGHLSISTEYYQHFVTITVKDSGHGMTKKQLERLGEPFYSTKGKNGTGLGMMVVYSIVRAMDGTIDVVSEIGDGTTIQFEFPALTSISKKGNK